MKISIKVLTIRFSFTNFCVCRGVKKLSGIAAVIVVLSVLLNGAAHAALYSWTKTMGGTGSDSGSAFDTIARSASGNIYMAGSFSLTADFNPDPVTTDNHTSAGLKDIFLTMINADGSYGWTRTMGGTGNDVSGDIAVDDSGNVYVAGDFSGTVDFAADWGETDSHTSAGIADVFITRINADGSYGWTKTMGGMNQEYSNGVAVDGSGNIYVAGVFHDTADFNPDPAITDNRTPVGAGDIFLTRINANGSYDWTKTMGGPGTNAEESMSVRTDSSGNIYLTGGFADTVDFNPDPVATDNHTSTSTGSIWDIYLTRINADGSYGWTKTMGGSGDDMGVWIAVDGSGNVYVSGMFNNTVDFDPDPVATDQRTSKGGVDGFITMINADGSYGWTRTMGGTGDDLWGGKVDDSGNIYMVGVFSGTVNFAADWGGTDNHTSVGGDAFLTRINSDNTYGWTKTMGGTGIDWATSIVMDDSDNIYLAGTFEDSVDFDPGTGTDTHTSAGLEDIFLTKLFVGPAFVVSPQSVSTGEDGTQDTFTVKLNSAPAADVTIGVSSSDTSEGTVSPTNLTFTDLNWNGLQTVTVTGIDDDIVDGSQDYTIVLESATSSDGEYNGLDPSDVTATNADFGETAGYIVSSISGNTDEEGTAATYTVRLASEPVGNVVIDLVSSDTGEGVVSPSTLTFTALNWNDLQTVTVTGVDDHIADSNQAYTIQMTTNVAGTTDVTGYASLDPSDVAVINIDIGETAGYIVSAISSNTGEDGTPATFMVRLSSEPEGDVVIDLVSSDPGEGMVSPSTLTFTDLNWNDLQTVTVTGVDDDIADGNQAYTIQLITNVIGTADVTGYASLDPLAVAVINLDDDAPVEGGGGGGGCFMATAADVGEQPRK